MAGGAVGQRATPGKGWRSTHVGALIDKLRGHGIHPLAVTGLFTGMRLGKLVGPRWRNADIDTARMTPSARLSRKRGPMVSGGNRQRRRRARDISLPDIVETLREHRRRQPELRTRPGLGRLPDDALVFPYLMAGRRRRAQSRRSGLAAAIGMPHVTFHALRHTHHSQLIDAGVDIVTIGRRPGMRTRP